MSEHQVVPMAGDIVILGVSTKVALSGVFGAAIGSVLGTGTWWERVIRGLVGLAFCYAGYDIFAHILRGFLSYIIPLQFLPSITDFHPATALFSGILGLLICQTVINVLSAISYAAPQYVTEKIKDEMDDSHHPKTDESIK